MAVDPRLQSTWAALVAAANSYNKNKNTRYLTDVKGNKILDPIQPSRSYADMQREKLGVVPEVGDFLGLNLGRDGVSGNRDTGVQKALNDYSAAQRTVAHEQQGLIPSPAPQPSESRGQLRVDLDTSPVQTKDSVMYRNAGDGEESTIGEASRPNKRKPGLSSNLGINL